MVWKDTRIILDFMFIVLGISYFKGAIYLPPWLQMTSVICLIFLFIGYLYILIRDKQILTRDSPKDIIEEKSKKWSVYRKLGKIPFIFVIGSIWSGLFYIFLISSFYLIYNFQEIPNYFKYLLFIPLIGYLIAFLYWRGMEKYYSQPLHKME